MADSTSATNDAEPTWAMKYLRQWYAEFHQPHTTSSHHGDHRGHRHFMGSNENALPLGSIGDVRRATRSTAALRRQSHIAALQQSLTLTSEQGIAGGDNGRPRDRTAKSTAKNRFPRGTSSSHAAALRVAEAIARERRAKIEEEAWLDSELDARLAREEALSLSRLRNKIGAQGRPDSTTHTRASRQSSMLRDGWNNGATGVEAPSWVPGAFTLAPVDAVSVLPLDSLGHAPE